MKKILILFGTLALTLGAMAQEEKSTTWECNSPHSISINVGSLPLASWEVIDQSFFNTEQEHRFEIYDKYTPRKVNLPSFDITYNYRFNKRFSLSATLAYSNSSSKFYDLYNDAFLYNLQNHAITLMPTALWHWYTSKSELVTLYSSLGLGVIYTVACNAEHQVGVTHTTSSFTAQFTYFGITVGKRLYGVGELGVGTLGLSRIGIGYKF